MSEPLVLVVLLATSGDPTSESMLTAARRALGPEATVVTEATPGPSDGEALAVAEHLHARAVARISWEGGAFEIARIHVHVAPANDWSNDELRFAPQDQPSEKGRTLGYTLASMVQRIEQERGATQPRSVATSVTPRTIAAAPLPRWSWADVGLHASGVVGGDASALGGGIGARIWPLEHLGLRVVGGLRGGEIDAANARTTTWTVGVGVAYRQALGSALEVGARAGFVGFEHVVSRDATTRSRWLGGLDLLGELGWTNAAVGVFVAAGAEVGFGSTSIAVAGAAVGELPTLRAVGELGGRIRF